MSEAPKDKPKQKPRFGRQDTEHVYIAHSLKEGKPLTLKFLMRNGKTYPGELVEMGAYLYVVKMKFPEGGAKLVFLYKHAIDMVIVGDAE